LRARLLGSLSRDAPREVTWLRVISPDATELELLQARRGVEDLAQQSTAGNYNVIVERADDFAAAVARHSEDADLLVLGLRRPSGGRRVFGELAPRIAAQVKCSTLVISRGS
jgi:nucleotide-binding universal stress UspA family protein